jgi:hypothetical protein
MAHQGCDLDHRARDAQGLKRGAHFARRTASGERTIVFPFPLELLKAFKGLTKPRT